MTDRKSVNDKVEALSADISDTVHDLLREAKPLLHHATDRMTDRVNELTQKGLTAASKGRRELENSGHDLMDHASHMIRHEPFKAMLVAAGIGAAGALLIVLMTRPRHRSHSN
jgi:ElaB/YqjD/DUF883 family membrane-anchored ribosome-binding protein